MQSQTLYLPASYVLLCLKTDALGNVVYRRLGSSAHDLRKSATIGKYDNVGLKSIITRKLTCVL